MRTKQISEEKGREMGIFSLPFFHYYMGVRSIRKRHWGMECHIVYCHGYYYNCDSRPDIWESAEYMNPKNLTVSPDRRRDYNLNLPDGDRIIEMKSVNGELPDQHSLFIRTEAIPYFHRMRRFDENSQKVVFATFDTPTKAKRFMDTMRRYERETIPTKK